MNTSKNLFMLALLLIFIIEFGCKKSSKNQIIKNSRSANFFPSNVNAHWMSYYHNPLVGDTNAVVETIDSIYLCNDTIGLKIISQFGAVIDTTWKTFNVLKVHKYQRRWLIPYWEDKGVSNFGLFRIDTISNKVYGINTVCLCKPSQPIYPTDFFFNERVIYDHDLQSNDTLTVKATWYSYNTTVHTDSVWFAGDYLKKQYFTDNQNPNDTVSTRMQFACILNTSGFVSVALPNSVSGRHCEKLVFYNGLNDSIELIGDTHIYP